MKNKLKTLLIYVRQLKCPINFEIRYYNYGDVVDYIDFNCPKIKNFDISSNIEQIFYEIAETYSEPIFEKGLEYQDDNVDTFVAFGTIYPDKLVFDSVEFETFGTEESGEEWNKGDDESSDEYFEIVEEFMDNEGINNFTVTYGGSGDDGAINNEYESDNKIGQLNNEIDDLCYRLLENFGGWEINEGSQGTIIITRDTIRIEHNWNVQEYNQNKLYIVITPETMDL